MLLNRIISELSGLKKGVIVILLNNSPRFLVTSLAIPSKSASNIDDLELISKYTLFSSTGYYDESKPKFNRTCEAMPSPSRISPNKRCSVPM